MVLPFWTAFFASKVLSFKLAGFNVFSLLFGHVLLRTFRKWFPRIRLICCEFLKHIPPKNAKTNCSEWDFWDGQSTHPSPLTKSLLRNSRLYDQGLKKIRCSFLPWGLWFSIHVSNEGKLVDQLVVRKIPGSHWGKNQRDFNSIIEQWKKGHLVVSGWKPTQ